MIWSVVIYMYGFMHFRSCCLCVCLAIFSLIGCADQRSGASPEMPPFSENLQKMQSFYKFAFLPDGYPGREDGWAHPIYGVYVLRDYLTQYEAAPSDQLKKALASVAYATVGRMSEHHGALVFWYEADPSRGARLYDKHYSGLTQGYYAEVLYRVGDKLKDPVLLQAASRVFDSLTIPVEDGGVLHNTLHGPVIAEVPQKPNAWILNGWQSALVSIHNYATLSGSEKAKNLFLQSAQAMAAVMHLYDMEDLANSRYGLTGFAHLRIKFSRSGVSLKNSAIVVPGESAVPVGSTQGTRWQSYYFDADVSSIEDGVKVLGSAAHLNAVLSFASAPEGNRIEFDFLGEKPVDVSVDASLGSYSPLSSAPVKMAWVELGGFIALPGERAVFEIPADKISKIAYPTNFVKKIDGGQVNVYHPIHIERLRKIAQFSGLKELDVWADKWDSYICRWASMDMYQGYKVRNYGGVGASSKDPIEACGR